MATLLGTYTALFYILSLTDLKLDQARRVVFLAEGFFAVNANGDVPNLVILRKCSDARGSQKL